MIENILNELRWIYMVAGGVWVVLTVFMIWVLLEIYKSLGDKNPYFRLGLFLLAIVWLYPVYTGLYQQLEIGFVGNIFTLFITILYMSKVNKISKSLPKWMIPQSIWLTVATFYTGLMIVDKYSLI